VREYSKEEKKRFGNNKKRNGIEKFGKNAIRHAFQSLQQQICVYGFFSYMPDDIL
jgi:hypothetical protein